MASFEDHFSEGASTYAQYRPQYPGELFTYLASISPSRQLAWDCGTGNGQAAINLAKHFDRVAATDASSEQLAQAFRHEQVDYWVARAEAAGLKTGSADLVTVAVAVHWFDLEKFYQEIHRVLKPDGILAVWTYHLPVINPRIDRVLAQYYTEILAGYWPAQIRYLDEHYTTLPFPFAELYPPAFEISAKWNLGQLLGFLDSWSATRRYEQAVGEHPAKRIWQSLADAWGEADREWLIRWPLHMRVGKQG
jgi:SAM-dependent methyltransferase